MHDGGVNTSVRAGLSGVAAAAAALGAAELVAVLTGPASCRVTAAATPISPNSAIPPSPSRHDRAASRPTSHA